VSRAGLKPIRTRYLGGLKPLFSSMRWIKWAGVLAAVLLIVSCFFPWIIIESRQLVISGIETEGSNYGKPGYFHILMAAIFLLLSFIPRVWAKRVNLLMVAMNFAWGVRNYFMLSRCEAGDCPDKQIALYLALLGTGMMMIAALFPDMKLPEKESRESGVGSQES